MVFRNIEIDFDIYDADTAEIYEAAAKRTRAESVTVTGETLADAIRRVCTSVFNFFDDVVYDGFHKDVFGEKVNLLESIKAFREFVEAVDAQKSELNELVAQTQTQAAPNRAARRAVKPLAQ